MKTHKVHTHQDIARMVGVSQSTVSRALDPGQRHLISAEVVARVLRVAAEIGFQSNVLARRLRSRRAETITLVVPGETFEQPGNLDFEVGHSQLMWLEVKGVMHEATARGYDVKVVPQYNRDAVLAEYIASHVGYPHSDGVIFAGLGTVAGAAEPLVERGIPCVATGAYPLPLPVPLVACDQEPGIAAALAALFAAGHRRIAFFAFAPDFATGPCWVPRHRAYTTAMERAGLLDPALVFLTPGEAELRGLLRAALPRLPFTAAFCTNDTQAARLVRELGYLGTRVPGEVAVVGFDNHPLYQHGEQALSSVELPLYRMGRAAMARLAAMIDGEREPPMLELIPSSFVPRRTS